MSRLNWTPLLVVLLAAPAYALSGKPILRAMGVVADDAARVGARAAKAGADDVAGGVARLVKARPALVAVTDEVLAVARHVDLPTARAVAELGPDAVRAAAASPVAAKRWGRLAHLAEAEGLPPVARRALASHAQDGVRLEALLKHAHRVGFGAALLAVGLGAGDALESAGRAVEREPELLVAPARGVGRLFTLVGVGGLLGLTAAGLGLGVLWRRRRGEP